MQNFQQPLLLSYSNSMYDISYQNTRIRPNRLPLCDFVVFFVGKICQSDVFLISQNIKNMIRCSCVSC